MVPDVPGFTVKNRRLLLDGKHFLPRGFALVAGEFMPPTCNTWECAQAFIALTDSPDELAALEAWGCNTVRLSACQAVLTGVYSIAYMKRLTGLIDTLTNAGFAVIVQMFDAKAPPCGNLNGNINEQTIQAWAVLAPVLAKYPTVMLETCNEPTWEPDPLGWFQWHKWNHAAITTIRKSYRSPRPILVQGCHKGMTFRGMEKPLKDQSIVYTVHPYNFGHKTWELDFGHLAAGFPVLASEWYNTDQTLAVQLVPEFLAYLLGLNIGLLCWVFDSFSSQQLVKHNPYLKGPPMGWEPQEPSGQTVKDYFNSHA